MNRNVEYWDYLAELDYQERLWAEECAAYEAARQYQGPHNFEEYMEEWFYYWHREMDGVLDPIIEVVNDITT